MFGTGVRYIPRFELVGLALLGVLAGIALATHSDRATDALDPVVRAYEASPKTRRVRCSLGPNDVRMAADLEYRAKRFDRAAATLASYRPSDADLQTLALQYERLGRAWAIGMDPWNSMIEAFPAVREAWKLDTVLGGAHADELQAQLRVVAPRAALAYMARKDYVNAELALHTAQVLGVNDSTTTLVGEVLADHAPDRFNP